MTMTDVLLTPDPAELALTKHGLPLFDLLTSGSEGTLPGRGFCASYVELGPGQRTEVHYHERGHILVIVLTAGTEGVGTDVLHLDGAANRAVRKATWADELRSASLDELPPLRRYVQHPGQLISVDPCTPHRAVNLSDEPASGIEVRIDCTSGFTDNNVLSFLNDLPVEVVPDPVASWRAAVDTGDTGAVANWAVR